MRKLLLLIPVFYVLNANAQPYSISFAGTGLSSIVNSVKIDNLTSGTSLTVNGNDILRLTITTGVYFAENKQSSEIKIFPNPMAENSIMQIYPPEAGNAIIMVFDMAGKMVVQLQSHLEICLQEFRLSGIDAGFYLITVKGNNYQYSGKILSNSKSDGKIRIEKISNNHAENIKEEKRDSKGTPNVVDMIYTTGDRLKFTGVSGNYSTVISDIPNNDKTITFNFIACTDGDGNNYPVVEIGSGKSAPQVWMAENLRTSKYKNGNKITYVTDSLGWRDITTAAYCWYRNDSISDKYRYGALYNWFAVNTGRLCPTDWHVPTDAEWAVMANYLETNGYNFDGSSVGTRIAKALASTEAWNSSTNAGAPGNTDHPEKRNASGFTAFPGGYRFYSGGFLSKGNSGFWWTSSEYYSLEAYIWSIGSQNFSVGPTRLIKRYGFSVRCVKD